MNMQKGNNRVGLAIISNLNSHVAYRIRYPNYKYQPQKRQGKKTRKYMRRSRDRFTSRVEENNRIMEQLYGNPRILEEEGHKIAIAGLSPFSDYSLEPPTTAASARPHFGVTQVDLHANYHDPLITHCLENQTFYALPMTWDNTVDFFINNSNESLSSSLPPSPTSDYSAQGPFLNLPLLDQDVVSDNYDTSCINLMTTYELLGNQCILPTAGTWFWWPLVNGW